MSGGGGKQGNECETRDTQRRRTARVAPARAHAECRSRDLRGFARAFRFGAAALAEVPRLAQRGGGAGPLRIPSDADAGANSKRSNVSAGRLIAACEPDFRKVSRRSIRRRP
jgi:hypothetical protein